MSDAGSASILRTAPGITVLSPRWTGGREEPRRGDLRQHQDRAAECKSYHDADANQLAALCSRLVRKSRP